MQYLGNMAGGMPGMMGGMPPSMEREERGMEGMGREPGMDPREGRVSRPGRGGREVGAGLAA